STGTTTTTSNMKVSAASWNARNSAIMPSRPWSASTCIARRLRHWVQEVGRRLRILPYQEGPRTTRTPIVRQCLATRQDQPVVEPPRDNQSIATPTVVPPLLGH